MGYRKNTNPYVDWPVKVSVPADGGQIVDQVLRMRLKRLDEAGYQALFESAPPEVLAQGGASLTQWRAARIAPIVEGWQDVTDVDGNPVPFSKEELQACLAGEDGEAFLGGIYTALIEIRQARAPAKNWVAPPATGPSGASDPTPPASSASKSPSSTVSEPQPT